MADEKETIKGLSIEQVRSARAKYGFNTLTEHKKNNFISSVINMVKEPMFILLMTATAIYFITGHIGDGIFMGAAIVLVSAISLYQESKSNNAIEELDKLSQPMSKVIRESVVEEIPIEEIVVGDFMQVEEGSFIPADGIIIRSNDFSINESVLTGESMAVFKNEKGEDISVLKGTTVASGLAICKVTAIGNKTRLGKLGKSLGTIEEEKSPLQKQIGNFVKWMSIIGLVIFGIVWGINFYNSGIVLDSLLKALTLAMSIIPEEIPVAFTTFMALGAWRMMKMGVIVKQIRTVETLGSATVICTDKTGTITENKMSLAGWYSMTSKEINSKIDKVNEGETELLSLAMWASEPIPFDAMEIALHEAYGKLKVADERGEFKMVHEYPLGGKPPMMTHIFESKDRRIVAAKGAPEAMIACCTLSEEEKEQSLKAFETMTKQGFRVLGVGVAEFSGNKFLKNQQDYPFVFKGLVAFYDPPKANIRKVFDSFYKAGIEVKIVTGDNAATTGTIAKQIGFRNADQTINGDELMAMDEATLRVTVMKTAIFTRMFPEAKLRIIKALKDNNQVVAMTGDGVNDGPALKSAHIGIAMGKKGTEIAKEAASLILVEDDLAKMVDAIAMGRKIYVNLKKAIQYVISIHIPIILIVFIPLALGWIYPNIFSPVHIIFLEIIMGPTCSIIYENEPMEKNLMSEKPRAITNTFFNRKELTMSIVQGLTITLGLLVVYMHCVQVGCSESLTRTVVFLTLITANIFLSLSNRSFIYSIGTTLHYKNKLLPMMIVATIFMTWLLIQVPVFSRFFLFEKVPSQQIWLSILIGSASVLWIEIYKGVQRMKL